MYKILNKTISKIKHEPFSIDEQIPWGYMISFIIGRIISLFWGMLRLRTVKKVFVHPSSVIKCSKQIHLNGSVTIERGCFIDALSKEGLILGKNVSFGYHTCLRLSGSMLHIGNGAKIGHNVGLGSHGFYGCGVGTLEIGDDCIFGNYVSIHPENHNYADLSQPIRLQGVNSIGGVKIGNNCWIGAKATILDGTRLGDGCIVAAGAVVKGEFPDNVIIGGIPAKIIKNR